MFPSPCFVFLSTESLSRIVPPVNPKPEKTFFGLGLHPSQNESRVVSTSKAPGRRSLRLKESHMSTSVIVNVPTPAAPKGARVNFTNKPEVIAALREIANLKAVEAEGKRAEALRKALE